MASVLYAARSCASPPPHADGLLAPAPARHQQRRDEPRPGAFGKEQGSPRQLQRRQDRHPAGTTCRKPSATSSSARCACRTASTPCSTARSTARRRSRPSSRTIRTASRPRSTCCRPPSATTERQRTARMPEPGFGRVFCCLRVGWTAPHPPAGTFSPQAGRRGRTARPALLAPFTERDAGRQVRGNPNCRQQKTRPKPSVPSKFAVRQED